MLLNDGKAIIVYADELAGVPPPLPFSVANENVMRVEVISNTFLNCTLY